jgi:hypothetical protein
MVTGIQFFIKYNTDGITTVFPYPYYLFQFSDLIVWYTDANNNSKQLVLNADYTLAGTADEYGAYPEGVDITLAPVLPGGGGSLFVTRGTQKTQLVHYIDDDSFPANVLEHALDKLTLIAQEQTLFLGLAPGPPVSNGTFPGQWYQSTNPASGNFGWVWSGTVWLPWGDVSL